MIKLEFMSILDAVTSDKFEEVWNDELMNTHSGKLAFDRANDKVEKEGGHRPYSSYKSFTVSMNKRRREYRKRK